MDFQTLIDRLAASWPTRYQRGRVELLRETITQADGSVFRVSLTIQKLTKQDVQYEALDRELEV